MVKLSRRGFLISTGWVAGGATLLYSLRNHAIATAPTIIFPDEASGAAWLQIRPDGSCRMFFSRQDMGQNANTGLAQIVAEELNIEMKDIEGILPTTSDVPPLAVTAGSMSLTAFSRPTAIAAATLRESLRSRAAVALSKPLSTILDDRGGFRTAEGHAISYAQLVDSANVIVDFDDNQPTPSLYTFDTTRAKTQIGQCVKPLGIRQLVTGGKVFASDIPMEGILYGRVIQPPVRSAQLADLDTAGIAKIPGVVQIVHQDDFIGVVCKTPSAVDAAIAQIKVTWDLTQPINQSEIERLIDVDKAIVNGDLEHTLLDQAHRKDVDWEINLRFDVQVQAHAQQEPRAAIARFNEGNTGHKLEIWTGTQDAWAIKRSASRDTGLPEEDIVVHPQRMGGGFGGREYYEVERDAVRLARAVKRPVKVQWTREDEFTASRSRPASAQRVRIATDSEGNLSDWWHSYISGYVTLARERLPGWLLPIMRLGEDSGVVKGAVPHYSAPHRRVEYQDVDFPIDLGVWRSLNGAPALFAIESAMDELAVRRGADPVDYKIAQMKGAHPRLQHCLEEVREISERRPLPKGKGYGRGFACGSYDGRCFVAVSADVYVDDATRQIKVLHMSCAQDVGLAINPDQLRAQVESNMAWSVGMALLEKFEVANNSIQSANFGDYRIPRMTDMPSLTISIIDQPSIPPTGAGEVALVAGVPAIANAVRQASGVRPLRLPISYEAVSANDLGNNQWAKARSR